MMIEGPGSGTIPPTSGSGSESGKSGLASILCPEVVFWVQTLLVQVFYVQDVPGEEVEELKEFEREHLQQLDTQALNIELTQVDDKLSASR
jgi:hypothetical protein